ncbi:MAG: BMP family ABC transporter substrate-binding protein [Synergistaceae bacterium]|jgi:basic membrane protein A|nr:BMP family ABC transporter substrate-binding protein [Synergistaceae bacterium]
MKKIKKGLLAFASLAALAAAAVFLFSQRAGEVEWKPGSPLAKERVKIGVLYTSDPFRETGGYSFAHEAGIRKMQEKIGLQDDQILRKVKVLHGDAQAVEHTIMECIFEGANVIIATSWSYVSACEALAFKYPGVVFVYVGGNRRNGTNFTYYFGRAYQARYLSGIVAGLKTTANKLGYVAAMGKSNSEVTNGVNAFALGVESVNPDARVYVEVTHRWFYPEGETQAARSLIEFGCDVITQHCDTPNPQIEAQRAGVWGIGYSSDMKKDAPSAVLTSVMWNWGVYYEKLIQSLIDGSFTTEPYIGDLKDGMVGITPLNEPLLPPNAAEAAAAARKRIENGEFDVFEGPMETNDGQIVGYKGGRFSYGELSSAINWYYRNVTER